MVRLPQAQTPEFQTAFRKVRDFLPTLFSASEIDGFRQDLLDLGIENEYGCSPVVACWQRGCIGHNEKEHYERVAEAIIGRVLTHTDNLDTVKEDIVRILESTEHGAMHRAVPSRFSMPPAYPKWRAMARADRLSRLRV